MRMGSGDKESFAALLREARAARQITQAQLAERLHVGQQAISNWERGTSRPQSAREVRAIASLFPEYDLDRWLKAAGRGPNSNNIESERNNPARPLLDALPLGELSPEQFEEFCAMLISAHFPGAQVNRFGVAGDRQDGIDIEAQLADGSYLTFQCKRVDEFGPAKVAAAITAHKRTCDRAYILLSREATAAARKAVPKTKRGARWTLWDQRDIAREMRQSLTSTQRLALVNTFFPRHRKDFLGVDEPSAFESAAQHFAPLMRKDVAFSHAWNLVGRETELKDLLAALEDAGAQLTVVVGAGGVGKTRLVLDAAETFQRVHPTYNVLFLSSSRQPTSNDFDEIRTQRSLLIIEDAHDQGDLTAVFHAASRLETPPKLLITTRPYALELIRGTAMAQGYTFANTALIELKGLSVDRAEEVAREILKEKHGPHEAARDIAQITHDSPFALVIGSYLVATQRIHPATLNNLKDFKSQLLQRFRDAVTGEIAAAGEEELLRDALSLVALVRPVDTQSPAFKRLAEHLIAKPLEKIRRALQLLDEAGVLIKRGRFYRVTPELLGDYLLEQSCIAGDSSLSLGYAERALEQADASTIARILVNVSSLDWRLSAADKSAAQLIETVWSYVEERHRADLASRKTLLEGIGTAAYYQPRAALRFYDRMRTSENPEDRLALLLRNAAMHIDYLDAVCERLWELGKSDSRALSRHPHHPVRLLTELAAIEPRKPLEFSERMIEFAIRGLSTAKGMSAHHSLFEILDAALSNQGSTTENRGHAVTIQRFSIRRPMVASLRQRIIRFLIESLLSKDLFTASRAAKSLGHALRYPVNADEAAHDEWSAEFRDTLKSIETVVTSSEIEPAVLVNIARAISWHAGFGPSPTLVRAQAVIAALPRTLGFRITNALMDGWGTLTRERNGDSRRAMTEWRDEQKLIANELLSSVPDVQSALDLLRERLCVLKQGAESNDSAYFLSILTESRPDIAEVICRSVLQNSRDPFHSVFGHVLLKLAMCEAQIALQLAQVAISQSNLSLQRNVAWTYANRLRSSEEVLPEERALVQTLVQSEDDTTVTLVLPGISGQNNRTWTIETLLLAPIGRSEHVANEVFSVFALPGDLQVGSLDDLTTCAFLDRLAPCPTINSGWILEFLSHAASLVPMHTIDFLMKRIDRHSESADASFHPLPFGLYDHRTHLNFRDSPDLPRYLLRIREWILKTLHSRSVVGCEPQLYAAVAGEFDQIVVTDLETWVRSSDADKLTVVGRILAESPPSFVFDQREFVVDLLDRASLVGEDCVEQLISALWSAAAAGVRRGTAGSPFPQDLNRRDLSDKVLAHVSQVSPAWRLYYTLKLDAQLDIRRKQQMDDEFFVE